MIDFDSFKRSETAFFKYSLHHETRHKKSGAKKSGRLRHALCREIFDSVNQQIKYESILRPVLHRQLPPIKQVTKIGFRIKRVWAPTHDTRSSTIVSFSRRHPFLSMASSYWQMHPAKTQFWYAVLSSAGQGGSKYILQKQGNVGQG